MNDGRRKMKRRKSFKRRTMGVVLALALVTMTVLDYAPVAEAAVGNPATEIWMAGDSPNGSPRDLSAILAVTGDNNTYENGVLTIGSNTKPYASETAYLKQIPGREGAWAALYANGDLVLQINSGTNYKFSGKTQGSAAVSEVYGIYVDGNLTIRNATGKSPTISAKVADSIDHADLRSAGIYCTGTLTIEQKSGGTLTVNATGGKVAGSFLLFDADRQNYYTSAGIYAAGGYTQTGGTVSATGGIVDNTNSIGAAYASYGLYTISYNQSGGTVTATGGEVKSTGGASVDRPYSIGLSAGGYIFGSFDNNGTVTISDGTLTATGGTFVSGHASGDSESVGIGVYNTDANNTKPVSISGGTIVANGGACGSASTNYSTSSGICVRSGPAIITNKTMEVSGSASVTAGCGIAETNYGICAGLELDGSCTVEATTAAGAKAKAYGINATEFTVLDQSSAHVDATANALNNTSGNAETFGINVKNAFTLGSNTSAVVNGTAYEHETTSYGTVRWGGICLRANSTIQSGTVKAEVKGSNAGNTGHAGGFLVKGDMELNIEGGNVTGLTEQATGDDRTPIVNKSSQKP